MAAGAGIGYLPPYSQNQRLRVPTPLLPQIEDTGYLPSYFPKPKDTGVPAPKNTSDKTALSLCAVVFSLWEEESIGHVGLVVFDRAPHSAQHTRGGTLHAEPHHPYHDSLNGRRARASCVGR
eukprot:2392101-Rhodomonas_salina.1